MSTRRQLLRGAGIVLGTAALPIAAGVSRRRGSLPYELGVPGPRVEGALLPTIADVSGPTLNQTEGPFYSRKTPRRRDLRDDRTVNAPMVLTGRVLDTRGNPLSGAVLDFWHTTDEGEYDNMGFRYRGHQFTDADGRYELTTIAPQAYSALSMWRTGHIHVKAQGRNTRILTTQLYRPDTPELNARDRIYHESLVMTETHNEGSVRRMRFDFVLADV